MEVLPLLITGLGLGLLHALETDHVLAVSVLGVKKAGAKKVAIHSLNWALGHSAVLLIATVLLFGLGWALPELLQRAAEFSVGILLVVLGLMFFLRQKTAKEAASDKPRNPVLVGLLHGLAGSAPALALIPAVSSGQFLVALLYVLLFCLGVVVSMLSFGFGFGYLQKFLLQKSERISQFSRYLLATVSIAFGGYWMVGAL